MILTLLLIEADIIIVIVIIIISMAGGLQLLHLDALQVYYGEFYNISLIEFVCIAVMHSCPIRTPTPRCCIYECICL